MAKDPAFLFYSSDFLSGIQDLTMEERGQYITLLCVHHQKGRLTEKMIRLCCGNATADVLAKFRQDKDGFFYNERLEEEMEKRKSHSEKQRQRAVDGWERRRGIQSGNATASAAVMPLENENENRNEIEILNENEIGKTIEFVKITGQRDLTKEQVQEYWKVFLIHSEGEFHNGHSDKIQHFRNWIKKQPNGKANQRTAADTAKPGSTLTKI